MGRFRRRLAITKWISRSGSSLDDLVADRIPHQFADRVNFQLSHDIGPVRLRCFDADS